MSPDRKTILLPMLLVVIGVGWLLTTIGIAPAINWIWTLSITGIGIISFAIYRLDKVTVVVGPFFIVAGLLSILRQTGRLTVDIEMPILVILAGVLMIIARTPSIPVPNWYGVDSTSDE